MNEEIKILYLRILKEYLLIDYMGYITEKFIDSDHVVKYGKERGIEINSYTRNPINNAKVTIRLTLIPEHEGFS